MDITTKCFQRNFPEPKLTSKSLMTHEIEKKKFDKKNQQIELFHEKRPKFINQLLQLLFSDGKQIISAPFCVDVAVREEHTDGECVNASLCHLHFPICPALR